MNNEVHSFVVNDFQHPQMLVVNITNVIPEGSQELRRSTRVRRPIIRYEDQNSELRDEDDELTTLKEAMGRSDW